MKKKRTLLILALVAVAGASALVLGFHRPRLVLTGLVTTDELIVSSQVQGRLEQLACKPGDVVKQGQLLGVISPAEWKADLAYFDPPYGSSNEKMPPSRVRYAAYYHLWTSICLYDKPALFGKAKRRADTSDTIASSVFEDFRKSDSGRFVVVEAIERLLKTTRAGHIILSYSSGGRATAEEFNEVINSAGKPIEVLEIDYRKNVMAGMRWTNEWVSEAETPNREFLFLIEK